jgi:hypothetical protein
LPTPSNQHPADALAEVRHQIKALEAREGELRQHLIDNPDDRIGDTWGMRVESFTHRRLDLDAALMRLGLDLLEPYLVEKEFAVVRLARVREEERKTHAINPEV